MNQVVGNSLIEDTDDEAQQERIDYKTSTFENLEDLGFRTLCLDECRILETNGGRVRDFS